MSIFKGKSPVKCGEQRCRCQAVRLHPVQRWAAGVSRRLVKENMCSDVTEVRPETCLKGLFECFEERLYEGQSEYYPL